MWELRCLYSVLATSGYMLCYLNSCTIAAPNLCAERRKSQRVFAAFLAASASWQGMDFITLTFEWCKSAVISDCLASRINSGRGSRKQASVKAKVTRCNGSDVRGLHVQTCDLPFPKEIQTSAEPARNSVMDHRTFRCPGRFGSIDSHPALHHICQASSMQYCTLELLLGLCYLVGRSWRTTATRLCHRLSPVACGSQQNYLNVWSP